MKVLSIILLMFLTLNISSQDRNAMLSDTSEYKIELNKAKNKNFVGIGLITTGVATILVANRDMIYLDIVGGVMILVGGIFMLEAKQSLLKAKSLLQNENSNTTLNLETTESGIGLVLRF